MAKVDHHPHQKDEMTWILVCDNGKAKLFLNRGAHDGVHEMAEAEQFIPKSSELTDHDRGRNKRANQASQRHAYEPSKDPRKQLKEEYVKSLANALNQRENKISQLLVAAPPKALHTLREELSPQLKRKVIGEINKDLTHENESTLPRFLKPYMALYDPQNDYIKNGPGEFGAN